MAKLELLEYMNNCEVLSKKLKLESCNSNITSLRSDTVKCLDVLKSLRPERTKETDENACQRPLSSRTSLPRKRLRAVLQNRTNTQESKVEVLKKPEKTAMKDATNPGTISELIAKVPSVEQYFTVKKRIGFGTFSSVFLAAEKPTDIECLKRNFALKHIYSCPSNTKRVLFEIKCLKEIGGCDNIMSVKSILGNGSDNVLVMPYYRHDRFSTLIKELSLEGVKEYIRSLLIALRRVHKFNVIHRDVKPSNFLYDIKTKKCALVDFGLAHNAHYYKPTSPQKKGITRLDSTSHVRTKTITVAEVARSKPGKQIKKSLNLNTRSTLHTRSSSMVALAKNIHNQNVVVGEKSRKRLSDDGSRNINEKPDADAPGNKRLRVNPIAVPPNRTPSGQHANTPRPAFRKRPGFETRQIPIFAPQVSTPSPVSIGSERGLTSPLASFSIGTQSSGRTIGDMLPNIRAKTRASAIWSKADTNQQRKPVDENGQVLKSNLFVPRAGTSGFRAPEVLTQCPHQTTAVDIWSVGVMLLSLLSGRYPFFKPADDMESLAQIIAVFGTEKIKKLARCCNKKLSASYFCAGTKLFNVVESLRKLSGKPGKNENFIKPATVTAQCTNNTPANSTDSPSTFTKNKVLKHSPQIHTPPYDFEEIPPSAFDLLSGLLDVNPLTRLTAKEALEHEFFN